MPNIDLDQNAQFDFDDLYSELLAKQLVHEAKIIALEAILKAMASRLFADDIDGGKELIEIYEETFRKQSEKLLRDNIVIQQLIKNQTRDELEGDIPGIHFV